MLIAGAISYPLYVSHVAVLDYVSAWLSNTPFLHRFGADGVFSAYLSASLLAALALAYGFDKPLRRLLKTPLARRPPRLPPSTVPD